MSKPDVFLDSSALFAGIVSANGAARVLSVLAEAEMITVIVSEQVLAETERAVARKVSQGLREYRKALRHIRLHIVRDPSPQEVTAHGDIIAHEADVPIAVAAMKADVGYLVTFNRRHFIDDAAVTTRSGLRIGAPGDALAWVRQQLETED